jgi:hypothetical protein
VIIVHYVEKPLPGDAAAGVLVARKQIEPAETIPPGAVIASIYGMNLKRFRSLNGVMAIHSRFCS